MRPQVTAQSDLLLVGGGHAHVIALRMLAMRPLAGLRISLVSPDTHTPYSGMLPGLVAGHYRFEDAHIDLPRLCHWAGVRFIRARACGLQPAEGLLELEGCPAEGRPAEGRPALGYDLLSLDIGSSPELASVPGAAANVVPVKPVSTLWQRWQTLRARLDDSPPPRAGWHIAVVGGGAGSVELVLAMAHALASYPVKLVLVTAAEQILPEYNRGARAAAVAALARYGVGLELGSPVRRVEAGMLHTDAGILEAFDEIFWCTGAAAAPWIRASGLATDAQGFLALRDTLQAEDDERVFGAGDIATQSRHPRPKAGVYAVRQGPVLAHNLRQYLLGRPLRRHRPQQRFLSLLSLGEQRATADRGPFSVTGAWVWRWKHRIDRRFMQRFQELPPGMARAPRDDLSPTAAAPAQMPCGGCGAKVGADPLALALEKLRRHYPGACDSGAGGDDTATLSPAGAGSILQSVDVLREMLADPWRMGQLAAHHALSDLYASGARPLSALAIVTLPFATEALQQRELEQLLAGALAVFGDCGCVLAGGHSLQGPELTLGFAVNGVPMDAGGRTLSRSGLRLGDQLLLTKPLGTGVLYAAAMQGLADGRDLEQAETMMLQSNRAAAELAVAHGATAATDVTGFGLLGHLRGMLAPDQGVHLDPGALPALPGARELLAAGVRSSAHTANQRAAADLLPAAAGEDPGWALACDPQTSGGLLLGVPAAAAPALLDALHTAGHARACVIGEVSAAEV